MPAERKTNQSRRLTAAGLIAVTAATLLMMAWAIFPTAAFANGTSRGALTTTAGPDRDLHPVPGPDDCSGIFTRQPGRSRLRRGARRSTRCRFKAGHFVAAAWAGGTYPQSPTTPDARVPHPCERSDFLTHDTDARDHDTATAVRSNHGADHHDHGADHHDHGADHHDHGADHHDHGADHHDHGADHHRPRCRPPRPRCRPPPPRCRPPRPRCQEAAEAADDDTTAPTTTTTTTASPTVAPTTIHKSTTTTDEVLPTTVTPGGTAFTGVEDVVPIGAIALMLMTSGSGLLWAGSRRRRHDGSEDED